MKTKLLGLIIRYLTNLFSQNQDEIIKITEPLSNRL